ncbi:dihydrolipoamide acetyltransferase family protein [uncultured Oceanisphaera sp.]|uniref:dihydrolipoamide acetyltransferase family protein n=1 Tax=uncultured Oceanisphaera sp. TaxID=353858 RepID=UPI0026324756|nr:dihydrolipoamide acetyltransferase family protein [uncultured Oceanisphaera sp.]
MIKTIKMPSFGSDMAKGMVAEWKIQPGDTVHRGEVIATIETMKGLIDMEVFDDGVVEQLLAPVGQQLQVGEPIARLQLTGVADEGVEAETEEHAVAAEPQPAPIEPKTEAAVSPSNIVDQRPLISPAARKQAEKLGIDWRLLGPGSGPNGALVLADIESRGVTPSADSGQQMRQAIAAVVSRSKRDIPHYYLELDIPLAAAHTWCSEYNKGKPAAELVLINALIYCALARALAEFPQFNGFYREGGYQAQSGVHLGNIIKLRSGGMVVAALHDAQLLGAVGMMARLKDQVIRARGGGLRGSEVQDATVTVSNLGERGVDRIQGVIFPPQVALLGIGRVRTAPWVQEQKIVPMTLASFSLAADHRVSDGHDGARLLNRIAALLQQPEQLA